MSTYENKKGIAISTWLWHNFRFIAEKDVCLQAIRILEKKIKMIW